MPIDAEIEVWDVCPTCEGTGRTPTDDGGSLPCPYCSRTRYHGHVARFVAVRELLAGMVASGRA
jgi:DnaJ-class molecular chaperone